MSEPFIGEINIFAGNFAPRGWHFCDGTLLNISSYTALFSILGTTYGGDGRTTFALPDLRGRVPLSFGQGSGLSNYRLGQKGGAESVTLTANQTAPHNHSLMASTERGSETSPDGKVLSDPRGDLIYEDDVAPAVNLKTTAIGETGSSGSHENRQPYLACHYIIALVGIYPQRS